MSLTVGGNNIVCKMSVRNLGVLFDTSLTMNEHIASVSRSCYAHLRGISKIRSNLSSDSAKLLVHASVISRLDYANSLLHGISETNISKMQKIQNYAAKLISGGKKEDHVKPILASLH